MRKSIWALAVLITLYGCKTTQIGSATEQPVTAILDLVDVQDDKVRVSVDPNRFTTKSTTFYIPKTVPGTYSEDNYGKFIEGFTAIDYSGAELPFERTGENSWSISNAVDLDRVSYLVNDSYDVQGEEGVFSPSGTNIEKDENFMLNLHGFVGYFENLEERPYRLVIQRPDSLIPGTSLTLQPASEDTAQAFRTDVFALERYFGVIDHPIMYAEPDTTSFMVEGMEVLINVYSPNNVYSSESIKPGIQEMISAQKRFLGDIDNTSKYAIMLYLAEADKPDARGFGALEHHTSTVVVLPESMPAQGLQETMTDVVSHEFFHILTPLNIHSEQIHYFDFNDPEMSQHLWMYEGVTEYFANLFQVNQELIDNQAFYDRLAEKIESSKNFDDTVPFTRMSENILEEEYADSYYNVYLKGALIGMALDISLRELSNGETGILDLMKDLSQRYGKDRPFEDDELIPNIVEMTYPEIQSFFDRYVTGTTAIPYEEFFDKVGITQEEVVMETDYFMNQQIPYIDANPDTGELFFRENISYNSFLKDLGVQGGDILKSINGTPYNLKTAYNLIVTSQGWEEGEEVSFVVMRDGEEVTLTTTTSQPTEISLVLREKDLSEDHPEVRLRQAWLKD